MSDKLIDYDSALRSKVFFKKCWQFKYTERCSIPSMMDVLFGMTKSSEKIPTQTEFLDTYMRTVNIQEVTDRRKKKDPSVNRGKIRRGIICRAARSYPSLVRDIHLPIRMRALGHKAFYIKRYDIKYGIDVVLKRNGSVYYIHCFVNSSNAFMYRRMKNYRHPNTLKGYHVDAPMSIRSDTNTLYVYDDECIKSLVDKIDRGEHEEYGNMVDTKRY